jgi:hypothetical protein
VEGTHARGDVDGGVEVSVGDLHAPSRPVGAASPETGAG